MLPHQVVEDQVEVFQRKKILGFRKSHGERSVCTACEGFKQELRRAKGVLDRQSVIEAPRMVYIICSVIYI